MKQKAKKRKKQNQKLIDLSLLLKFFPPTLKLSVHTLRRSEKSQDRIIWGSVTPLPFFLLPWTILWGKARGQFSLRHRRRCNDAALKPVGVPGLYTCISLARVSALFQLELGFAFKRPATWSPGAVLMPGKTEAPEIALGIHRN